MKISQMLIVLENAYRQLGDVEVYANDGDSITTAAVVGCKKGDEIMVAILPKGCDEIKEAANYTTH